MQRVFWIVLLLLCLLPVQGVADSSGKLQRELNKIRSMQANFEQVVTRNGKLLQHSAGKVSVYRPGRFRWDIRVPNQQVIVADGMKLWHYEVELKQVTVSRLSQLSGTASLFLSSSLHGLGRRYRVTQQGSRYLLESVKKGSDAHRVEITLRKQKLTQITVKDNLGNISTLSFKRVRVNIPLSGKLFEFTPPKGVDVIS